MGKQRASRDRWPEKGAPLMPPVFAADLYCSQVTVASVYSPSSQFTQDKDGIQGQAS
jgi:hypothetical protein